MIIEVIRASLLNLRRDRGALLLTFILPLAFFSIFAFVFGGSRSGGTKKVRVALVDLDQSPRSIQFAQAIRAETTLRVIEKPDGEDTVPYDRASAEAAVRGGDLPVAIILPKGFGSAQLSFAGNSGGAKIELLADSSDQLAPEVVNGTLQKLSMTALPTDLAYAGLDMIDQYSGGLTRQQRSTFEANLRNIPAPGSTSSVAGGASVSASPITVEVKDLLGEKKSNPVVAFYAAGIGVMFLLFSATGAAGALLEEQENGTLDRVLSTRITMTRLLAGKMLFLAMIAFLQLVLMFVWGATGFGVQLRQHLDGFLVMAIVTSLAASSFGLFMATLCRTRAQLSALSTLLVLIISAVGGSMLPRYLMPESLQKFSLIFFNSWALEGFLKVFWREEPTRNLWPEVTVLLLTTAIFALLARRLAARWDLA